jgi:cytochrome c oxidase accessory protein FixG
VSIPDLWTMMRTAPREHWSNFAFIAASTGVLYFNFAWFREQLCIVICPYGRLQSALVDENTLVIGYDARRGEPRMTLAGAHGGAGVVAGDCVACNRCVQVCPTGIDIRDGLQLECVGCTACIDACDDVMTRLHRPRGLIRYDSPNGLAGRATRWLRPRVAVYGVLLAAGAAVSAWALSTVHPANFEVTRMVGAPYIVDAHFVRNQFLVRLINKRAEPRRFVLSVRGGPAGLRRTGLPGSVEVPGLGELVEPLVLQQPRADYGGPFRFTASVRDESGGFQLERQAEFLGPDPRLLREDDREEGEGGHE